jgi:hypothetical protein
VRPQHPARPSPSSAQEGAGEAGRAGGRRRRSSTVAARFGAPAAVSSLSAGRRGAPRRGGSDGVDGGGALGVGHLLSLSSLPSIRAKAWWLGAGTAGGVIPFVPPDSGFGVEAVERNGTSRFTVPRCGEINGKSELQFALRSKSSLRCGQPEDDVDGKAFAAPVWRSSYGSLTTEFMACLGELQLCKNSSRAADPRSSIVEQLHRGSQILESVWYSSNVVPMSLTSGPARQKEKKEKLHLLCSATADGWRPEPRDDGRRWRRQAAPVAGGPRPDLLPLLSGAAAWPQSDGTDLDSARWSSIRGRLASIQWGGGRCAVGKPRFGRESSPGQARGSGGRGRAGPRARPGGRDSRRR